MTIFYVLVLPTLALISALPVGVYLLLKLRPRRGY